jgi:hypothetical protein
MSEAANSHLGDSRRDEAYNNPKEWYWTRNAPLTNLKKWQRRIDGVVGKTITNEPIVRIVWAWNSWETMYGRRWQRHSFMRLKVGDVDEDISVPRWAVEQRVEPELFVPSWESTRYQKGADGKIVDCGAPPKVFWDTLWVIADHEGFPTENPKAWCCRRAKKMDRPCWGFYRAPTTWDIEEMRRRHALKLRDERKGQSPFKPLTPEYMATIKRATFEKEQKKKEEAKGELRQRLIDHFLTHGHRLSSDPGVVKNGQYHFMSGFKQKARCWFQNRRIVYVGSFTNRRSLCWSVLRHA